MIYRVLQLLQQKVISDNVVMTVTLDKKYTENLNIEKAGENKI